MVEFKGSFKSRNSRFTIDTIFNLKSEISQRGKVERTFSEYNNPLSRDFSRIPGYLKGSNNSSLFGYVMRDLSNRFLLPSSDRQRRQRSIRRHLLPPSILVVCPGANTLLSEIKKKQTTKIISKHELIKSFGYRIGESFLVESIYNGHNTIGVDSNSGILGNHRSNTTDILLAVFDPEQGREDSVVSGELEQYIRSGIIEYATFPIASMLRRFRVLEDGSTQSDDIEMHGIATCKIFLDSGYKLQVLSSSNAPTDGLNPYPPNTILRNEQDIKAFLSFGTRLVEKSEQSFESSLTNSSQKKIPKTFHSLVFATRGLDLAIPSRRVFLNLTGYKNDHVLNIEDGTVPFLNCPKSSRTTTLRFRNDIDSTKPHASIDDDDRIEMACFGRKISIDESKQQQIDDGNNVITIELWHSHKNISLSEAACLRCTKISSGANDTITEHVCATQILSSKDKSQTSKASGRNLLAIELRGVHQEMLNISMPRFRDFSRHLGLEYFPNFVSIPTIENEKVFQNWWTSGASHVVDNAYQRYHGSNQCDPSFNSSDMLYHGSQIGSMFCFHYDRPNCLGGKHAATHLFDHVKKFIKLKGEENERWSSYITLIDGHEETESLVGTLDRPLSHFLYELRADMSFEEWSKTVITIFSADVQKPILFLKVNKSEAMLLKKQNALFTSDINHIMQSIITNTDVRKASHSNLTPDHFNTITSSAKTGGHEERSFDEVASVAPPSILSFYADIPKEQKFQLIESLPDRPIERALVVKGCQCATNLDSWFECDRHPWNSGARIAKETYILVDCPDQPIHLEVNIVLNKALLHRKAKKKSESLSTHLNNISIMFLELDSVSTEYADRHFPKTRELLKKYRINRNGEKDYECVDGICSAEFPYTSLVGANSIPNQVAALSGCITSTAQELCGLVNATKGDICQRPDMLHYGLRLERIRKVANMAYWCPNRDLNITKTPWIFGVSDSKAYINFFGEEFCYENSPYVTQGNVFPKFFNDIESHKVFCNLVQRKVVKEKLEIHEKHLWGVDLSDPCLDGYVCSKKEEKSTISLEFLKKTWETYAGHPKFAFLNAMAAHDYSFNWEMMISRAETYDEHFHKFLDTMLSREDRQQTVIIIRSDHGLQKGPMASDYSIQVEHRHPWTEILVPENLVASKSALFANQARMLTGYDLYRTMRVLMSNETGIRNTEGGIPDWSFDILAEEISQARTCQEAKVDPDLCRRVRQTRHYGICNYLDSSQARFCSTKRVNEATDKP